MKFAHLLAILILALGSAAAFAEPLAPHVPGELIVGFREGVSLQVQSVVHAGHGALETRSIARGTMQVVRFDERESLGVLRERYLANPDVEFADPNYIGEAGFVPGDTHYASQWQHHNIGQSGGSIGADISAQDGWDIETGSASVVVAVLDTGIDTDHPEFAGRLLPGWDFVNEDSDPEDDQGHGTLVTALLAANTNNGFAVAGVDHACMILPIKVVGSDNFGTTVDLIEGIDFAVVSKAQIINMSLINYPSGGALNTALRDAKFAGLVLMACAGNGGIGDADNSGPGASNHTISIGATTDTDARASFSGTGQKLDLMAPGDAVVTARFDSFIDGISLFSGCSAATPIATGIASILKGLAPGLGTNRIRGWLRDGAEDLVGVPSEDTPGWDEFMGWGRVSLKGTMDAYLAAVTTPEIAALFDDHLLVDVRPNPSRGDAQIQYTIPAVAWVRVSIYDVTGRHVKTLVNGIRTEGAHEVQWGGRDEASAPVGPGVYFARVESNDRSRVRKLTRIH